MRFYDVRFHIFIAKLVYIVGEIFTGRNILVETIQ